MKAAGALLLTLLPVPVAMGAEPMFHAITLFADGTVREQTVDAIDATPARPP
ncbi:MAG: hypothetical protein LC624_07455 [Halobacteriales archaeon]|nr:hypothetical protein [Halobacteriales archaeon]